LNRGPNKQELKVKWSDIGLAGSWKVRDLWMQKDVGVFRDVFTTPLASHETRVLRLARS